MILTFCAPLVLNDAGIACLPRQLVQKDIENGRLVELLQDYVASTFDICLYYRKLEFAPVRMNNFKTSLENYCRQPENMANLFKISSR
ncbi:LysR substrate-binding domain-containing protein [Enterobacter asburiae]|uniref:LysR substrate-binding domain-containing protein n=1 Tax=Enterobacter asburiae TaxID=61645 RepID=UPI003F57B11C